jgi:hypothetical protein
VLRNGTITMQNIMDLHLQWARSSNIWKQFRRGKYQKVELIACEIDKKAKKGTNLRR